MSSIQSGEDIYSDLTKRLPVGIVVTTPAGGVLEANSKFVEIFGFSSKDEIKQIGAEALYHDPRDRSDLLSSLKEGTVSDYEVRLKRRDGSVFWGSFNSIARVSTAGEPIIYTALQDVTERKQYEKRLRMLEMALEQTIDGVIVTDLDGKISFVNKAFAAMHGYNASDLTGEYMGFLHTRDQLRHECESFNSQLMLTGFHQDEVGRKRYDGSTFSTWTTGTLLRDDNGEPVGFVKTVHDISEQKTAEDRLRRINDELMMYAHAVSHGLKGPLLTIDDARTTLREVLREKAEEPAIARVLDLLNQGIDRAFDLVEDLLSLSEAGQASRKMTDVEVDDVVGRILEERSKEIAERGVRVILDEALGQIFADPVHVYELFSHIIENALVHNESEAPVLEIRHLGEDESGMNSYLVRDNGAGIAEGEVDKIFLPFWKGEGEGTGMGLAIVDKIIRSYNGGVDVYNDNGTCFRFSI